MSSNHDACRFSATLHTEDIAALHMLRGLSQHFESGVRKQISWGGTGADDWRQNGNQATFRFTDPGDRQGFLADAARLLPTG